MTYFDQFSAAGMNCVQQKGLLKIWERARGEHELPKFDKLPLDELTRSLDKMSFCEVEHTAEGHRFRIEKHGEQFTRMYNSNCAGKYLHEVIAPAIREQALQCYVDVVNKRQPSFAVNNLRKGDGPIISYERLLVPFTAQDDKVRHIITMITLFSEANGFDAADVSAEHLSRVDAN